MKKLIITWCIVFLYLSAHAQTITQTVIGKVTDHTTQEELFGATISLVGSNPFRGTTTGIDGTFRLEGVPVGRQTFEIRMIGYETQYIREFLVTSGKEVVLPLAMKEDITSLDEVTVVYEAGKSEAINEMATVSSRQFTVEETQRYAGGMNDPARLVSSFAGVATPSVSSNGISVRGNSPSGLLWRIEGVEVPSPNHFADLSIAGAGILTAMSSQLLDNSDFMTGAFPAEYGNGTSGVFDMNLRSGNPSNREHTAQIGILGVDFATEGPFKKGKDATYLINYRYSTLALIAPLLPSDAGVLKYQDLSFNIDMPTSKAGKFSFWGIGALDGIDFEVPDSTEWTPDTDRENSETSMYMFASGVNHQLNLSSRALLNTSLAFTGNGLSFEEEYVDDDLQAHPTSIAKKDHFKLTLQSSLTTYFGDKHYNKTGFYLNGLGYGLDVAHTADYLEAPETISDRTGHSMLLQFYSQSHFELSPELSLSAGLHSQYFQLNKNLTIEPRVSLSYQLSPRSSLALAYGLHSKTESLGLYFVRDEQGNEPNRELDLMKSHHWVLSYNTQLNENVRLTVEPYYQRLTKVPVAPDSYISTINNQDNLFFDEQLVSGGTGRNMGVDLTLEHYLRNGFYSLLTASVFDAKYTALDGITRNTRLNKNYVVNAVVGKEWQVGKNKNNTLSTNVRLNFLGGSRVEAIDHTASVEEQAVVYGESDGNISFTDKHPDTPIWSFTVSYRKNKPKHSTVWSLQVLNTSQTEEFDYDNFNLETQEVEQIYTGIVIPNLSYKIEF